MDERGVIDVSGSFGRVQIISCAGRFLEVIEDAVRLSTLVVREDSPLKIVPIPLLIALKLYAGGHKSKADIIELLVRNPDLEDGKKGTRSPLRPKPKIQSPLADPKPGSVRVPGR